MVIRWLLPSTWTVTGLVFVSSADLPSNVLDGDDRDDDLLRHGPAVDEASAADEVEAVRALGNPELHVAFGPGGHARLAVPGRFVVGQVRAEQVALLGHDRALWLVLQLALVRLARGGFREEEAVVGGDDDVVAVQVVDDVADQRRQFVDGLSAPPRKCLALGLAVVADGIDRVVVDVDHPLIR